MNKPIFSNQVPTATIDKFTLTVSLFTEDHKEKLMAIISS